MNYFDDIVACCRDLLLNFPEAKDIANYANKRLSPAAQEKFQLGYFPTFKNLQAIIASIGKDRLIELGLLYPESYDHKEQHSCMENHNLIIPYKDIYNNPIALVGRTLLDDTHRSKLNIPKYKNTHFKKRDHLFGFHEAKDAIIKNNLAFIVEGQFDCLTAQDKGLSNVVALGSSNMSFEQFALLTRYTNNIILLLDNDIAGQMGAQKIIKLYSKYANIKIATLPKSFKDIDEYLNVYSVDDLYSSFTVI
jgi:DNA primase